jgi:hypothetical protein
MQQWINRARAHFVTMASKLFNHPETHQRLPRSVVENVQPDKTADKLAVIRLLEFTVYGLSTHSCNPQHMIFYSQPSRASSAIGRFTIVFRY